MQIGYFDDQTAKCLRSLDSIESKDAQQKFNVFSQLSASIPLFPEVNAKLCELQPLTSDRGHTRTPCVRCAQ